MQELRRERHSVTARTVHLVCVTKYRRKMLDNAALDWLQGHAERMLAAMGCKLLGCDGEADHLHLLIEYPPKHSISALVNAFKGTSSRGLRKLRADIASSYRDGVLWSPSYFAASSGGAPLEKVKQYVQQQRASSSP